MNPSNTVVCLHRLLDREVLLHPESPDGLTSHLPMALQALQALGADETRMTAFASAHEMRFARDTDAPEAAPPLPSDWRALRGQTGTYAVLRAHFQAQLAQRSRDEVLREVLPDLFSGVAAAAFHGPIRVAHALQAGHNGELANALAYWAWRWQPVTTPPQPVPALDFELWAAKLEAAALQWTPQAPLISARIRMAELTPAFMALAGALRLDIGTLPQVNAWAAARYAATRSFTVLHIVTGLYAIEQLLAQVDETSARVSCLAPALTAAYLAARMSHWPLLPPLRQREWPEIVAAAIASEDDHVIKLVHVARQRFAESVDPVYHQAALRAVS